MIYIEDLEAAATATYDVVVSDPGEDLVGFRVVSSSSDQYAKAQRAIDIKNIKRVAAVDAPRPDMTTDAGADMAAEHQHQFRLLILKHCVVGWFGFASKETKKEIPFSTEAMLKVLKAHPPWVEQLYVAIGNDRNFMKG